MPTTSAQRADAAASGTLTTLWANEVPDEPAITAPSGDRTFGQLDERINQLCRALRARGARPGDAMAIVCGNRAEFAEALHAALRIGLRYTPINWHLKADEAAYIIEDCGAAVVVADAQFETMATGLVPLCPTPSIWLSVGGSMDGYDAYDDAIGDEDSAPIGDPVLGNRMLYTSGTTGRPKGVLRPPNYSTGLAALTSAPAYEAGTGQRNLCTGPLYHGGPLGYSLLAPLAAGVGVVLMERWDALGALQLIEGHGVTHTHMVPTMFHRLLRLPADDRARYDVSTLRYVLHGAAPCPVETKAAMMEWFGPVIYEYFAATEAAGASVGPEEWLARPGTVGLPPAPDHIRIVGDDGRDLPPGTPGTILVKRDPASDFQYFNDPAKTEAARRGNYVTVGDIGMLDEDGYLFITDRDADVIISGGVNIYPAEVESVLLTHPAVGDAAVIGVANDEWGEEVKAVIELNASGSRTTGAAASDAAEAIDAELIALCRDRLAHFKCPRSVEIVDRLPRQDNGKLYRNPLRDRFDPTRGATQ